jgi:hypothetical protein
VISAMILEFEPEPADRLAVAVDPVRDPVQVDDVAFGVAGTTLALPEAGVDVQGRGGGVLVVVSDAEEASFPGSEPVSETDSMVALGPLFVPNRLLDFLLAEMRQACHGSFPSSVLCETAAWDKRERGGFLVNPPRLVRPANRCGYCFQGGVSPG